MEGREVREAALSVMQCPRAHGPRCEVRLVLKRGGWAVGRFPLCTPFAWGGVLVLGEVKVWGEG